MRDMLLPVAKARGQVRLTDGRVATLIAVKTTRIRVWFAPNPNDAAPGTGHFRTMKVTDIIEVLQPELYFNEGGVVASSAPLDDATRAELAAEFKGA